MCVLLFHFFIGVIRTVVVVGVVVGVVVVVVVVGGGGGVVLRTPLVEYKIMREPFPKHTHTNTRYTCVIFYNLEKYVVIVSTLRALSKTPHTHT